MHFDSLDGEFQVRNIATGEEKIFAVHKYVTPNRRKARLLEADLAELTGSLPHQAPLPKAQELIDYMARVNSVYSAGLLGVLYMLEETVAYGGPIIAKNIDRELRLQGNGTRYLRGNPNKKQDLWEFRRSLDLITDYQTQVNVVTAAAITYSTYRDVIDPRAGLAPPGSKRLN
jgi:heme oxygenase